MTRILRYLGNREAPELDLYGHVDKPIARRSMIEPITYDVDDPKIPNVLQSGMKKEGDLFVPASFERELESVPLTFRMLNSQYFTRIPYYEGPGTSE